MWIVFRLRGLGLILAIVLSIGLVILFPVWVARVSSHEFQVPLRAVGIILMRRTALPSTSCPNERSYDRASSLSTRSCSELRQRSRGRRSRA